MDVKQLEQQAKSALDGTGQPQLRRVQVDVSDDEKITLRGAVSSYHLKQIAQTVTRINGCQIRNLIKVIPIKSEQ